MCLFEDLRGSRSSKTFHLGKIAMKDFAQLWNCLVGGTYDVVNTNARFKCDNKVNVKEQNPVNSIYKTNERKWAITFAVIGTASILLGVLTQLVDPYNLIFNYKIKLYEGGEIFEIWQAPPVDLYLRVYLWNITNKEQFMSGEDEKLKLQEVGPYVYKELITHENVTFNDNGTLTAIPNHPLVFVPEMSEGRLENDSLILPNIALLSIAHVVSDESYFTRLGLNMVIRQTAQQPLVQMTAREFMFNYTNTLMKLGTQFLPHWITFDHLGLIDRMYDFDGDYLTVFTGEKDLSKAGLIDKWRGSTKIPQWDSPCGDVSMSSDVTKFPPNLKPEDKLYFYRKSQCRAKPLKKINDTVIDTMGMYVYTYAEDDAETQKCFCKGRKECLPKGLLDVHSCYYGFPIALSAPHFWNDDPILNAKVEGMRPEPEKHSPHFVVEPITGTAVQLRAPFQINMALKNIKTLAHVERFSDMVLPLLWAEFRMYELSGFLRFKLIMYVKILPFLVQLLKYGSPVSGILLLLYSIYKLTQLKNNRNRRHSAWLHEAPQLIKSKLSDCLNDREQGTGDIRTKEMETYYCSASAPLTENFDVENETNKA